MRILFLHGLASGAHSMTARYLRESFPEDEIIHPEIPVRPNEAMDFLNALVQKESFDLLIGVSVGGFYALGLPCLNYPKLVINPALYADEDIWQSLGLGRHHFRINRLDGATSFLLDTAFIEELTGIRMAIEQKSSVLNPVKAASDECRFTYALFGQHDRLFDHYNDFAARYLPEHAWYYPGGHQITRDDMMKYIAPLIREIMRNTR